VLVRDGAAELLDPKATLTVRRGDLLRVTIPGAGGYGPPWHRDSERVLEDVRDEKVSVDYAKTTYAVLLDGAGNIDRARTEAVRAGQAHH